MSDISKEAVHDLIALARLNCSKEEEKHLASNLKKVLGFVKTLDQVDTSNVNSTAFIFNDLKLKTREDEPNEANLLKREEFLEGGAPSYIGGLVRVPSIGIK